MIILSIGSNIDSIFGDRFLNIKKTIDLMRLYEIKIIKFSSFYETPSYPNSLKPKFINIALSIEFNKSPQELLKKLLLIEKKMGRIRHVKNDPRTCDIDIIDFNGLVINERNLTLPHAEAHKRSFVMYPLMEIYHNWIHPINNKKIDDIINKFDLKTRNEITKLKESDIF